MGGAFHPAGTEPWIGRVADSGRLTGSLRHILTVTHTYFSMSRRSAQAATLREKLEVSMYSFAAAWMLDTTPRRLMKKGAPVMERPSDFIFRIVTDGPSFRIRFPSFTIVP